jgi:hypothetical protein
MLFKEVVSENSTEYTVSIGKVNLLAILFLFPVLILYLVPFLLIWDFDTLKSGFFAFQKWIFLYLIVGIVLHELLHGLTWAVFSKGGFRQIKFGVNWKYITPYTHFKKPLKVKIYLAGALMPLIVLGVFPAIAGIILGNGLYVLFGIFFTWAAAGDIISAIKLFQFPLNKLVQDHPDQLGFIIYHQATPNHI